MTAKQPLEGIRIVDFTWAWAGPYGTMLLALLGAEVIKIESKKRLDHSRLGSLTSGPSTEGPDYSPTFNDINLNKKSITLDLSRPEAVELAKRLIEISDVAIQNFRPGIIDKLGLGYEVIKKIRPDIIMLSSSALGSTGPEHHYIGYAPIFSSLGGQAHLTGFPDSPPIPLMGSSDLRSATTAAFVLLAALYYRARSGKGQHIDLSSTEIISSLIGEAILDYTMNQNIPVRQGNRQDAMAPHNYYPCKGNDKWVSIAIATEEEWEALCEAMGNPQWTQEERFSNLYQREKHQEKMDKYIEEWTLNYTPYEVMEKLQNVGVAAAPVLSCAELYDDPHLRERKFSTIVEHPCLGSRKVVASPWKLSDSPIHISRAPLLGEHNNYVFSELLKLPKGKIEHLIKNKIIY